MQHGTSSMERPCKRGSARQPRSLQVRSCAARSLLRCACCYLFVASSWRCAVLFATGFDTCPVAGALMRGSLRRASAWTAARPHVGAVRLASRATHNVHCATCTAQHAAFNPPHTTCNEQHALDSMQHAACDSRCATCDRQCATWGMQQITSDMTAYDTQHATHKWDLRHAAHNCNIQHVACN